MEDFNFKKVLENHFNCHYDEFVKLELYFYDWRKHLNIEEFVNVTIAYMRRTGEYGSQNKILMETFKAHLREHNLLKSNSVILGIALDNPANTASDKLRYDVGLVIDADQKTSLNIRDIPNGRYAIFQVEHTEQGVADFWNSMKQLTVDLPVDETKPILERYSADKIANHLCEFCVPLKDIVHK